MSKHIAFLRGINVGGNHPIKMDELRRAFEGLGLAKVKTILASGNVLFETPKAKSLALRQTIEKRLEETFGHQVSVILRSLAELQKLAGARPFEKIKVTPLTRLYVTFLTEKPKRELKIPYVSPEKDFTILRGSADEVCTVLTLTPKTQTTDYMTFLEKEFGRNVTTRNWNTIAKILAAE